LTEKTTGYRHWKTTHLVNVTLEFASRSVTVTPEFATRSVTVTLELVTPS
jgi:hypothetical protein